MWKLSCAIQQYSWGRDGRDSAVAKFKKGSDADTAINEDQSYAELWMGTHPSGPSKISKTGEPLKHWLESNKHAIGHVPDGYDASSGDLPFLFKVLSIKTALSIQAHPDKALAQTLHQKFPDIYKDGNHKPEMAIALTPFEALCGFRRPSEITAYLEEYPEFASLIGPDFVSQFKDACSSGNESKVRDGYRALFTGFMSASDAVASENISSLLQRLASKSELSPIQSLILRLQTDYPLDRGILCPLLLNYLELNPGECFFMGPNEPHAYLSGDCVECMALSDNVVRAGLTPKFKDVETLVSMLHYRNSEPSKLPPIAIDKHTSLYRPPPLEFPEFEVEKISVDTMEVYEVSSIKAASILLVVDAGTDASAFIADGSSPALDISAGTVLFVSSDTVVSLNSGHSKLTVYRAHINLGNM